MDAKELGREVGELAENMGIKIVEATPEKLVATMPVKGNTQHYGILNGGAHVVLAETLASIGAWLHAQNVQEGSRAVGIEVSASHHKAISEGTVTATATAVHLGGRIAHYQIVMTNENGDKLSTAKLTAMISRPKS
ncbi:MAG: PaaI family thioesterase [Micrococcaceae bacterium]